MITCMCSHSVMSDSATPWTVACQAPLFMGFPRQDYWSGLPFPTPGNLSDPGIKPESLASSALAGRFFTTEPPGKLSIITLFNQLAIPGTACKAGLYAFFPTNSHTPVLAQFSLWPDLPTDLYEVRHTSLWSENNTSYSKLLQWCPGT